MLYALLAIAVLVGLVTWLKFNPFIALLLSSLALGAMVAAEIAAHFPRRAGDPGNELPDRPVLL